MHARIDRDLTEMTEGIRDWAVATEDGLMEDSAKVSGFRRSEIHYDLLCRKLVTAVRDRHSHPISCCKSLLFQTFKHDHTHTLTEDLTERSARNG